jgi:cytochrome c-type biogenesis protein CcmE
MALKAKHQRLVLAVIALVAIIGAGLLAASALKDQAAYFYTPTELAKAKPETGKAIRLGGMVEGGSIKRDADGVTVRFTVIDQTGKQNVVFTGITPDLFVENSGVVAEGAMAADGVFVAENLLAKHDENYKPKELKDMDMDAMRKSAESME